jgi:hypothetical protein
MRSFCYRGHDGPHSSPPSLAGWIDVVVVCARRSFAVSEALHGLSSERPEVPSMPHIILGTCSKMPLWFPFVV